MIFLDANIILRLIANDHPNLSSKAKTIFKTIEKGGTKVFISSMAAFEVVFTLERWYGLTKSEIHQKFLPIVKLENVTVDKQDVVEKALTFYEKKNVSFADAYQVALMEKKKVKKIYSFDRHFYRFPHIKRLVS